MSTPLRLAALVLALPLALTACAGDDPGSSLATGGEAPAVATSSPLPPAPSPVASTAPSEPDEDAAQLLTLTVAGGKVSGDTGRAAVSLGGKVRLTVTADVTDEIHVHGYDLYVATTPGQAAQVEFVADKPGVYEVEFHDSGLLLTRLQVQ